MKQFKVNDRIVHEYLGDGTIIEIIKDFYNSKRASFYILLVDIAPDLRYNGGSRECLVLPNQIIKKELL